MLGLILLFAIPMFILIVGFICVAIEDFGNSKYGVIFWFIVLIVFAYLYLKYNP